MASFTKPTGFVSEAAPPAGGASQWPATFRGHLVHVLTMTAPLNSLAVPHAPLSLSIAAVERDTGLSKDTLRVWERRYGFPTPERDGQGERMYALDQLDKLRLIKRLLDAGHRPGRIVALPAEQLQQLLAQSSPALVGDRHRPHPHRRLGQPGELRELLDKVLRHDALGLRHDLGRLASRLGLHNFIFDIVGPLLNDMNVARQRGSLNRYQELWARDCLETVMRHEIASLPAPTAEARPRLVLATLPHEPRGLGRLMMHGLAALEGADCLSLGHQVPVADVVQAATAHRVDVVGICFSTDAAQGALVEALRKLREALPAEVAVWVAGSHHGPLKQEISGVQVLTHTTDLGTLINRWRDQHQVCV